MSSIFGQVDEYIASLLAAEDKVLGKVLKNSIAAGIPPHHISATQGSLLQVLAEVCNAKNILEIGTLGGYSTIWLARAVPENGRVITLEYNEHHAEVAKQNFALAGLTSQIELRLGKAIETLPVLLDEGHQFDMIFIDADKPPYLEYFQWAIKLSRPGTIIVADNVIREGKVLDEQSTDEAVKGVQRLNKALKDIPEVTATILQTVGAKEHDGMVIAVVK